MPYFTSSHSRVKLYVHLSHPFSAVVVSSSAGPRIYFPTVRHPTTSALNLMIVKLRIVHRRATARTQRMSPLASTRTPPGHPQLGFPLEYSKHSKWALAYFACGIFRCSRRNIPENRRNISKTKCMPTNRKVRRSKYSTRALFKSEYSSEVRGSPSGFVREYKRSYHHARAH